MAAMIIGIVSFALLMVLTAFAIAGLLSLVGWLAGPVPAHVRHWRATHHCVPSITYNLYKPER